MLGTLDWLCQVYERYISTESPIYTTFPLNWIMFHYYISWISALKKTVKAKNEKGSEVLHLI